MAFDHMSNSYNPWPLAKFYFEVTVDGIDTSMGFQSVEGLESEISMMEYRAGNYALWAKTKRPGLMTFSNVTLKKGMFAGDANLQSWWHTLAWEHQHGVDNRREVIITLLDENEEIRMTWTLSNAFCVKFTPTPLDAEADSEVAVEELELCCESWTLDIA